jgi:putative ABC transport system permease protein
LTGIVTGCIVLLMTAAGTSGVRKAIHALFDSSDTAREIYIFTDESVGLEPPESEIVIDAQISDARRQRIRRRLIEQWKENKRALNPYSHVTAEDLDSIRALPHVVAVVPEATSFGTVKTADHSFPTEIAPLNVHSVALRDSLLAGTLPSENDLDGALLHEFAAWQMGFRNDADISKLVGQQLTIEYKTATRKASHIYNVLTENWGSFGMDEIQDQVKFLKAMVQLINELDKTSLTEEQKTQLRNLIGGGLNTTPDEPDLVASRQFVIRGIVYSDDSNPIGALFRQWFHTPRGGVFVHPDVAVDIYRKNRDIDTFFNAKASIESSTNLRQVTDALESKNFRTASSLAILENIDYQIDRSGWIVAGIALAILITAAIGISNTLILSIVERTPEFGILKSIGARDSHIVQLMIAEGAILGLLGASIAIVLSLMIGWIGQSLLAKYVESRTQTQIVGSLFQFELLPAVLILVTSVVLCILASLTPAWRAARLDPVVAMRRT